MSPSGGRIVDAPLLLSRYRPTRIVARGGSSAAFRGRDEVLGRDVAIKLFNAGSESEIGKQQEELRLLAGLSHHGVVSIIDAGIDTWTPSDPRPFLVMEFVRGLTLRETTKRRVLSAREIGEVGLEIAEVLEYIHARGVIHRDITPSNIMLVDYGTEYSRPRARLTDFGIAIDRVLRHSDHVRSGQTKQRPAGPRRSPAGVPSAVQRNDRGRPGGTTHSRSSIGFLTSGVARNPRVTMIPRNGVPSSQSSSASRSCSNEVPV